MDASRPGRISLTHDAASGLIRMRVVDPSDVPAPVGGYAQAAEVRGPARLLFISGQIPVDGKGAVPRDFEAQCRLVWTHIGAVLRAASLDYRHLVKVTTFLADRSHAEINAAVRREFLGSHTPALTVMCADLLEEHWLLEIEAIAAVGLAPEKPRIPGAFDAPGGGI